MHTPPSLAWATILLAQGVVLLLWAMSSGALAMSGEKDGIGFWKTFLISFFMTPIAGIAMILIVRVSRPSQTNPAAATTRSAAASLRTSL